LMPRTEAKRFLSTSRVRRMLGTIPIVMGLSTISFAQRIITLDPPNSVNSFAHAINGARQIAGSYTDANNAGHGFLRQPDGTFISVDPPNAINTTVVGMNEAGQIAGYYYDGTATHGFLRQTDGTFNSFDLRNQSAPYVSAIGPAGEILGFFQD